MFRFNRKYRLFLLLLTVFLFHYPNISYAFVDVCIDPGHGGSATGAITYISGYYEKNVNLSVALAVKDTLDYGGIIYSYILQGHPISM